MSCEGDELVTFENVYTISCQSEADMVKSIIGDAIYNLDDPEVGFKGDIEILNPTGNCNDPIVDLSLFDNYRFWLGNLKIESDDITDLSFLKNIEQFRNGLEIVNCSNLTIINLKKVAVVASKCIIDNNPKLTSIDIGSNMLDDVYDEVLLDSMIVTNNAELTTWVKSLQPIDFLFHATVTGNPKLTSLESFSELSMPSRDFTLELFGTTVNPDGKNPGVDSLTMPRRTRIVATNGGNDYSWLNRAKDRIVYNLPTYTRYNGETFVDSILVDFIQDFDIIGEIEIEEVCDLLGTIQATPLAINSSNVGSITEQIIMDNCPE